VCGLDTSMRDGSRTSFGPASSSMPHPIQHSSPYHHSSATNTLLAPPPYSPFPWHTALSINAPGLLAGFLLFFPPISALVADYLIPSALYSTASFGSSLYTYYPSIPTCSSFLPPQHSSPPLSLISFPPSLIYLSTPIFNLHPFARSI